MPGLLQKPLFFGVSLKKNQVPVSLSLSLPSSLPPHHTTPSEILAPRELSFQPEIQPLSPGTRGPVLSPGQVSADIAGPPPRLVSLTNRNHFLLSPKLGCIQKFLAGLKRENGQPLHRRAHKSCSNTRGVKEQPQTQVRPQRSGHSLGPPRPIT